MSRTMTTFLAALLLAGTVAAAPPPPAPSGPGGPPQGPGAPPMTAPMTVPTAAPTDPAMLARAKSWFAMLQAGKIDRSQLTAKVNDSLTDARVSAAQSAIGNLGPPVTFVQQQTGSQGEITYAVYALTFQNKQKIDFFFAQDQQGKVAGLELGQPSQ